MSHVDHYPPLISPRSPSYERASREFLHPTSIGDPQVIALLSRLSEAEQNASEVCSKAAEMLVDESFVERIHEHAATHEARREALVKMIESLGGSAPEADECREILSLALDAAAHARSHLTAKHALNVMRDELSAAYDEAIRSPYLDDSQRASLSALAPALPQAG